MGRKRFITSFTKKVNNHFDISTSFSIFPQICVFVCLNMGLDLLQIWIDFSQEFCHIKNFMKSTVPVIIGLSISFSTVLKCYIICYKKSMPEMNDSKVSKFAIASILMASIFTNGIKFSGETKPTFNEVSSKFNFH